MKANKAKPIKINKIRKNIGRRLLDSAVLSRKPTARFAKIIALAAALGFLVGGALLGYLFFTPNPLSQEIVPEIILPEASKPEEPAPKPLPAEPQPEVIIQKVEILDTPTGFLNVRQGPGTNHAKISQVKPGEVYELVSEVPQNGGWYEIRLATGTGWVTKRYAQVK